MQMFPSNHIYADTYLLLWESHGYNCNIEQMCDIGLYAANYKHYAAKLKHTLNDFLTHKLIKLVAKTTTMKLRKLVIMPCMKVIIHAPPTLWDKQHTP